MVAKSTKKECSRVVLGIPLPGYHGGVLILHTVEAKKGFPLVSRAPFFAAVEYEEEDLDVEAILAEGTLATEKKTFSVY